ncbi:hypothetical protein TCAL_01216 [Tigriopus californicus]|uniref:NAD(P)H oxidase (H(2)O(2)-forming) n=1 Tax=Tigriopus californicus TaxID=6832 RepID=A0A553NZI7_TIGCA|nr:NADPH oxidase 5-like [Tigriopus californicus]TRY70845.1 hypothetical protein TCAL_01216 [Tigriopus californicus]|eukprot:TCALIF_01216-PA protein Name:"Similar to NOX5 NADPH oxidase 5 (Homo sapiens)" AED:0.02 eAED:0.02 QI:0/-1/0/1/-1/1/1/0/823
MANSTADSIERSDSGNKIFNIGSDSTSSLRLDELPDSKQGNLEAQERQSQLAELKVHFDLIAGEDGLIDEEEFLEAIRTDNTLLAKNVFSLFDRDGDGYITAQEFMDFMDRFREPEDKIDLLFLTYDLKRNEKLDRNELELVLRAMVKSSSLPLDDRSVAEMVDLFFEAGVQASREIDPDNQKIDYISKEGFRRLIEKDPEISKDVSTLVDHWLGALQKNSKPRAPKNPEEQAIDLATRTQSHPTYYGLLLIYLLVIVIMMMMGGIWHGNTKDKNGDLNITLIMARIFGFPLNLVCTMVFVFMLRKLLNGLRELGWGKYLPLDHHTAFHILSGWIIFVFGMVHTIVHFINFGVNVVPDPLNYLHQNGLTPTMVGYHPPPEGGKYSFLEWMLTTRPNLFGLIAGWANFTGVFLIIIVCVMFFTSQPYVRRGGYFNLFYFCHWLYVPFAVLLVLHAPNFSYFFPLAGFFLAEGIIQKMMYGHMTTEVESAFLLDPKCICLVIGKPENLAFRTGDWISVNIPSIAQYEWHAFTISSSPELPNILTLHIKVVGPWTQALEDRIFVDHHNQTKGQTCIRHNCNLKYLPHSYNNRAIMVSYARNTAQLKEVTSKTEVARRTLPSLEIRLDGPFHAPATSIFEAEHAVLVATGIGVTPMACILQSVLQRHLKRVVNCPSCQTRFTAPQNEDVGNLKKLDFIWVVKDPSEAMWFLDLLTGIEMEQETLGSNLPKIISITIYATRAWSNIDMDTLALRLAMNLYHKARRRDIIYGIKTKMIGGRPNFSEIFTKLKVSRVGDVSVFFCGNSTVGAILEKKCEQHKFSFHQEVF